MLEGTSGDLAWNMTATPAQERRTSFPLKSLLLQSSSGQHTPKVPMSGKDFMEFSSLC